MARSQGHWPTAPCRRIYLRRRTPPATPQWPRCTSCFESRHRIQGLAKVGDKILGRLEADRQPDECAVNGKWRSLDRHVRHARRMLDERLHRTERLGEREHFGASHDVERGLL